MTRTVSYELWAVIKDDAIVSIGPFPYFVEQENGFKYPVKGHYDPWKTADREKLKHQLNLVPVHEENVTKEYDPDLMEEVTPTDYVDLTAPEPTAVRVHNFRFVEDARDFMLRKLMVKAEYARRKVAPSYGGQVEEYRITEQQANLFLSMSDAEQSSASMDEWTFLAAGVGVDVNPKTDEVVSTLTEAATIIAETAVEWRRNLSRIRDTRKLAAADIRDVEDINQAYEAYQNAFSSFNRDVYGVLN